MSKIPKLDRTKASGLKSWILDFMRYGESFTPAGDRSKQHLMFRIKQGSLEKERKGLKKLWKLHGEKVTKLHQQAYPGQKTWIERELTGENCRVRHELPIWQIQYFRFGPDALTPEEKAELTAWDRSFWHGDGGRKVWREYQEEIRIYHKWQNGKAAVCWADENFKNEE